LGARRGHVDRSRLTHSGQGAANFAVMHNAAFLIRTLLRLNGEIIAKRIIEVACDGERDTDEACARALRAFGFQQSPNC